MHFLIQIVNANVNCCIGSRGSAFFSLSEGSPGALAKDSAVLLLLTERDCQTLQYDRGEA
mgnify:FL=1